MKRTLRIPLASILNEFPYYSSLDPVNRKYLRETYKFERFGIGIQSEKLNQEELQEVWRSSKRRREDEKRIVFYHRLTSEPEEKTPDSTQKSENNLIDLLDIRDVCNIIRSKYMLYNKGTK